jgi:hypothetical protein
MYSKVYYVKVSGLTPILQNNEQAMLTTPKKDRKTSYEEHEQQYWLNKAFINAADQVYIPEMWPFKTMVSSQRQDACAIKPASARRNTATLKDSIISGIYCEDSVIYKDESLTTPLMKTDLKQFLKGVNRGTPQSPKKVIVVRPMTPPVWFAKFKIVVTDATILKEHVEEIFKWAGTRNGLGDWRPQRGGRYGIYKFDEIVEG